MLAPGIQKPLARPLLPCWTIGEACAVIRRALSASRSYDDSGSRQSRDGDDFNHEVGVRKRSNTYDLGRRRVVVATVFRAMLGKELIQQIEANIGPSGQASEIWIGRRCETY